MEKNKNQRKINLSIKYELKSNSQNLRAKTIENTRKEKNKTERKIISKSPNSLIKKAYIHSLLKSSSTSNLRESKPKFQEKIILERKNSNDKSPRKISPFQNNYIKYQSSINNAKKEEKNEIPTKLNSEKLHKNLLKPEKPAKTKKDLKKHPFLSRLSLKTLETVQENLEIEELEEFSTTTSASNTPLKHSRNFSFIHKYLTESSRDFVKNKISEKKKIIKKPLKKPSKIVTRDLYNNSNYYNNNYIKNDSRNNHFFNTNLTHRKNCISEELFSKSFENNKLNNSYFDKNNCEELVNIEDLIIIDEKFKSFQKFINENNFNLINKSCLEWWNYYFNCSLKGNLSQFYIDEKIKSIIKESNTLNLLSILIIYELSFKPEYFKLCLKSVKGILTLNYKNYLLVCNSILSKIHEEYLNSIWVIKLKSITSKEIKSSEYYINQIDKNLNEIYELLSLILSPHKTNSNIMNPQILLIFNNYSKYSHEEIHRIFLTDILKIKNKEGSLLYSNLKNSYPLRNVILKKTPMKPLTIFLDLDETLISFVYNKENEGLSRIRPYLFQFLNSIKNYYDLIIFTASTRDYADPILDVIERKKGTYFTYRLYRESCSIINNYYIKDISKFGRDLSKSIIVDNMAQNFKLQKENGILISSFWGEDTKDDSLFYLEKILVKIAFEMIKNHYLIDIRDLLFNYKEDILTNVSLK